MLNERAKDWHFITPLGAVQVKCHCGVTLVELASVLRSCQRATDTTIVAYTEHVPWYRLPASALLARWRWRRRNVTPHTPP